MEHVHVHSGLSLSNRLILSPGVKYNIRVVRFIPKVQIRNRKSEATILLDSA